MPEYTNSSLVQYTHLSPHYRSRVNKTYNPEGTIDKLTIHHMAGKLSVETCGKVFDRDREASSNYGIGPDGRIALYVEEKNRAITSSNRANDYHAVTIEVANDVVGGDWHVSDASLESLIKLCIDICQRNGIKEINFTGDATGNLTMHKWFVATTCPGPYLESKFPWIAEQINATIVDEEPAQSPDDNGNVLVAGTVLNLKDCNLYSASNSARRSNTVTGTYFIWSSEVINGRIKITNKEDRVGVEGQVTGWINLSDATGVEENTPQVSPDEPKKTVREIALEVLDGNYGNGADRKKNLESLGYSYDEVQSEVNKIVAERDSKSASFKEGDKVKIQNIVKRWYTGGSIPSWIYLRTMYVRTKPDSRGTVVVSTVPTGPITGRIETKYLKKV